MKIRRLLILLVLVALGVCAISFKEQLHRQAAEDLFILAAETGINNVSVILSPLDFRIRSLPAEPPSLPRWSGELYESIKKELEKLEKPATPLIVE